MHIDGNKLRSGDVRNCDVCIIGSGAAGITLARQLRNSKLKVIVLEAGGFDPTERSQNLYQGSISTNPAALGETYPSYSRLRYFGGSTNHWGGWCRPFDRQDFEKRDWVNHSGWPFAQSELLPFYEMATKIVEIEDFNQAQEEAGDFSELRQNGGRFRFPPETGIVPRYFHYSPPTRFGTRYRQELIDSDHVEVITNANVTRLDMQSGRISNVRVTNDDGVTFIVKGRTFVLACGGLENSRILLNSDTVMTTGIGNQNDMVGRGFMEHPHAQIGFFVGSQDRELLQAYGHPLKVGDKVIRRNIFTTTRDFQIKHQTMNVSIEMQALGDKTPSPNYDPKTLAAMSRLARQVHGPRHDDPERFELFVRSEQEPDFNNRITLTPDRDRLGLRRLHLHVNFSERDLASIVTSVEAMIRTLSSWGVGRGQITLAQDNLWPKDLGGGCHPMGTTRMSNDPKTGVVDQNCQVHGIDNLYIGGSSIFPTGSFANPTLTIVALATRLGFHLKGKMT